MGRLRQSDFRAAWWLRGPHMQTLWPSLFRRRTLPELERERVELADGDFIDLALAPNEGPKVLVIHGLEGGLESHYADGILSALDAAGFRAVFMHLRGCSGEPNRLARSYHSGATEDLAAILAHLTAGGGDPPLAAIGYSLGGNLLLKHLGENAEPGVGTAIAVSVPFLLRDAMLRLSRGASRIYQRYLVGKLKDSYRRKFARMPSPLGLDVEGIRDFFGFDEQVTAPLHGFAGADDYYAKCSCRQFLRHIQTPTLIIHARDDPFMFERTVPGEEELGPGVCLELAPRGGHVGFVAGTLPWRPHYWLEARILAHLGEMRRSPL
jgi:predicted alpha/beta-fold hydrolase